jgi:hypothetical protein
MIKLVLDRPKSGVYDFGLVLPWIVLAPKEQKSEWLVFNGVQ